MKVQTVQLRQGGSGQKRRWLILHPEGGCSGWSGALGAITGEESGGHAVQDLAGHRQETTQPSSLSAKVTSEL